MTTIFVDTDVCLDLLSGRKPFNTASEKLFSFADRGKIKVCVSSLSFSNIDYILRSYRSGYQSRQIIAKFKTLVSVLAIDNKTIDLAIASDFTDFEDAIQYYCAIENNIGIFLTRNIRDYKRATIKVMTPDSFLLKFS